MNVVFDIGSGIYIIEIIKNTNRCIYKYPFVKKSMLFRRDVGFKGVKNGKIRIFLSN